MTPGFSASLTTLVKCSVHYPRREQHHLILLRTAWCFSTKEVLKKIRLVRADWTCRTASQLAGLKSAPIRKSNLEGQVVCEYVRKCPCDIRLVFYLAETELDVIGMDDDVVGGVQNLEVVCPDQDLLMDIAELAVKF